MSWSEMTWPSNKTELYTLLGAMNRELIGSAPLPLPAMSNCAALLWDAMPEINWAGFYLAGKEQTLVLGPFQGKPACTLIPYGRGVCGTAYATGQTQLVKDVHQFPGHIACDGASNAEIVIPLIADGKVLGVLDIDSPVFARFDAEDAAGLQKIVDDLLSLVDWKHGLLGV